MWPADSPRPGARDDPPRRGIPAPPADIAQTARSIAAAQLPCGAVGWPDGHIDPWDHVECAMALSACGLTGPARRGYQWLREIQRPDGSWPRTTVGAAVTDHAAESHHAAYVAVGVWHEFLVTGDRGFAAVMWPTVRDAIGWVLELQAPRGEVAWERDAAGRPGAFALLSGCSSILQGLRCAIALAELTGEPQPDWELAAVQLGHVLACHPEAFADKSRFAMDWYYPVLGGAVRGAAAADRLADGWDTFVVPDLGVRCVSDQPWVTVAETCELVLALDACGLREQAAGLLRTVRRHRHDDGSYWTGWQFANEAHFPAERSSWTAAAVVLAADALTGFSNGAAIFRTPFRLSSGDTGPAPAGPIPPADPEACGCDLATADAVAGSH
jgi:MMP endo-(1,4)-3-O-methyl-alpha-D-mannosidase